MAYSTAHGHFSWHDLITTDVPAATAFYKKVIGWKTQSFEAMPSYSMWVTKSGPIGGIGAAEAGAAAHWRAYISTDNIDTTVRDALRLGGHIVMPVTDIPNGGRYAVLSDPQGGIFGVHWSADAKAPSTTMQPGDFMWHELAATDSQSAFSFYQSLFGWERTGEHQMGNNLGMYHQFGLNGQSMGGMYNRGPNMPGGWCCYAGVVDARKTAAVVSKAGGIVCNGPMQVPGGGWIVQFMDPQGALHAVFSNEATNTPVGASVKPATAKPKAAKKKKTAPKTRKAAKKAGKKKIAAKTKRSPVKKSKKPGKKKAGKKSSKAKRKK